MSDETCGLIVFVLGIVIGIALMNSLWNTSQNEALCLKMYPNNAKLYDTCNNQSIYTNIVKIKVGKND